MMTTPLRVQDAAQRACELLDEGRSPIVLTGREGSGKSWALDYVAKIKDDKPFVHVRLPRRGDDAAFVGLVSVAAQMAGVDPPLLDCVRDPRRKWNDKLRQVLKSLEARGGLLLFDNPFIAAPLGVETSLFIARARELTQGLMALRQVSIVLATRVPQPLPLAEVIEVRPESEPEEALRAEGWSDRLAEAAKHLLAGCRSDKLARYSPLELNLAAALVAAGKAPTEFMGPRMSPADLVRRVLEGPGSDQLRGVLSKLALCRTAFDDSLLGELHADQLPVDSLALLRNILLIRVNDELVLHDLVAREAFAWAGENERIATHSILARWHKNRYAVAHQASRLEPSLRHEVETIHHYTEAGDAKAVLDTSVFFSEQYDLLGKALSLQQRHGDAIVAYERALDHDPEDAYAHHYIAWNLDVLARDPDRIDSEYRTARGLRPDHVWYHGRYICHLVTIGRLEDARDAWGEASARLEPYPGDIPTELHRLVGQLLLHRGQLAFAKVVLDDVPSSDRSSDWFKSLARWLADLEEAERHELVFPPVLDEASRWSCPHLIRDREDLKRISRWRPGYITSNDDGIRIRVAENSGALVSYAYEDIAPERLEKIVRYNLSLPVGTFVELIEFEDGVEMLLSWPTQTRHLPGLGRIHPAPDRFIRRGLTRG